MQVKVAPHSGFCFGVKRAINIAQKTLKDLKNKKKVYSLGPIIHNPQVVRSLSEKGIRVIGDIRDIKKGAVIISSHGAPAELIQQLKKMELELIDATCPFVKCAQDIVKDLRKERYRIIIIGDKKHPEVRALMSFAGRDGGKEKIAVIAQTTQNKQSYIKKITKILENNFTEVRIFNTICSDTSERQESARRLIKHCDVIVVVGGHNSANTRRLYEICRERGVDSYHIETDKELKKGYFRNKKCAGVISGASTPDEMVKRVVKKLEKISKKEGY